ncbi:MBL fold metallo-hydrolase [Fundidesulfovibrio butyratiphilus]
MKVAIFPIGPLETNSYLAIEGDKAVAVDVGGDPTPMLKVLSKNELTLTHILLTHLHFDHIYGVKALQEATSAPVLTGEKDLYLMRDELGMGGVMGLPRVPPFKAEAISLGEHTILDQPCMVLHTPGHTPGHLCFSFPKAKVLFAGDLIFYRSIGRTDFPGGDYDQLIESVRTQVFTLPGDTMVYPGHGPETTVADEKMHNPFFTEFTR